MTINDILAIDLPVIVLLLIRWVIEHFRDRHVDKQLQDISNRLGTLGTHR